MDPQFLAIARDPRIIPGVHHYCNEWCDYCEVTARCCGYLCAELHRKRHGRKDGEPTFTAIDEAVAFTRDISAAEGVRTDELDALLANAPGESGIATTDPLAELAWQYAERVSRLMAPLVVEWMIKPPPPTRGGPPPMEIVLWYHLRIYMKVFRALIARETHAGGAESEEARGCGKVALVSIDQSLEALARLTDAFSAADLADLRQRLTGLRDQLEKKIPLARAYIRVGLDEPVAVSDAYNPVALTAKRRRPRTPRSLAATDSFTSFVLAQLEEVGDVTARSMFGGVGLYHRGVFFALIARDTLYLKVGDANRADYDRVKAKPFQPYPDRAGTMKYYAVPIGVLESAAELAAWARKAIAVAEGG